MTRPRNLHLGLLAAGLLALGVPAACSDGGSGTSQGGEGQGTTAGSGDTVAPGAGAGSEFCTRSDELDATPSPLDQASPDPAAVEEYFRVTVPAVLDRIGEAAPADIAADFAVLRAGYEDYVDVIEANDWDLSAAFTDPAMQAVVADGTPFRTASDHLDAYCGTGY